MFPSHRIPQDEILSFCYVARLSFVPILRLIPFGISITEMESFPLECILSPISFARDRNVTITRVYTTGLSFDTHNGIVRRTLLDLPHWIRLRISNTRVMTSFLERLYFLPGSNLLQAPGGPDIFLFSITKIL